MTATDKPVILTVDDDPDVLRSIARDLRRQYGKEYRILSAESAASALEALEQLQTREAHVALLLSDQRMPRMDGVTFLGNARPMFPGSKRVLLTAYADTDAAIAAINRSQVDYYLLKPWDPPQERLYPVLDDLLEDWRASFRPGYGGVRIAGNRWSPASHQIKDFLARNHVPYRFLDVESDPEAREIAGPGEALPLVVLETGERLLQPTVAELAARLQLSVDAKQPFYQLAIVGAGPAGLAAAVYGASEGLSTVMIEREAAGGQAGTSSRIENYLGFPSGLSGSDLARRALAQARRFNVEILAPQEVTALRVEGPYKHVVLNGGREISCHALMLSMGVAWRRLPAEGANALTGRGVYYGAALTEAIHCRDADVYLVGAGNSAGQAAMYFSAYARSVTILVRGDSLEAKMSQYLVDRLYATGNIHVRLQSEVAACEGTDHLERIAIRDLSTGATATVEANYLFVFIGAAPRTEWLDGVVARDKRGFVLTGAELNRDARLRAWPLPRDPYLLETNVPGVFAAGDVRHESVKRVASAVGEGSVAVHFIHQYLASV